jgi:hypothetical protein
MKINTLQMEAEGSSETLVSIYQTTWHYIPEDCNLCRVPQVSKLSDSFTEVMNPPSPTVMNEKLQSYGMW